MAHKQIYPYMLVYTLTYAPDEDGADPIGARLFWYMHVQDMWKRIRAALDYREKRKVSFSYVCVGEKGSQNGRVHYHGVMFSDAPLRNLGEFQGARTNGFAYHRRLKWTYWDHGFVRFEPANRKGVAYVLKYILKGKMNAEKAKGTRREGKTEWLASSYLWCSKMPPIGAVWLWQTLREKVELGLCPPSLRLRVPDGGEWYVRGQLQKEMCLYLRDANNAWREEHGDDLAGWSTLVGSVSDEIELQHTGEIVRRKPWEYLINGEEEIEGETVQIEEAERGFEKWFSAFQREYSDSQAKSVRYRRARLTVAKCGNIHPCDLCASGLTDDEQSSVQLEYNLRFEEWLSKTKPFGLDEWEERDAFDAFWRSRLRPSRFCGCAKEKFVRDDFEALIPLETASPGNRYKKAIGKALQKKAH